jgi:hypothetical protein
MSEKNALVSLGISPGSRPLKHSKWERYARYRAQALPRIVAFRKLGNYAANDKIAHNNASRLENKPGVKDRIAYLTKQAEERIAEKRARLEEALWNIHEADVGDLFETYEVIETDKDGRIQSDADSNITTQRKQRPRLLSDLPPEIRKNIEKVTIDAKGRAVPLLYSKIAASQELRRLNNIGVKERERTDISQLSDAELISTLAQQAKELGIDIKLDYTFHLPKKDDGDGG